MNPNDEIGILGLNYESNLENFYIDAFKSLNYKKIKFLNNNYFFYIYCLLRKINIGLLFIIFDFFQKLKLENFINKNNIKVLFIFKGIELNPNLIKKLKKKKIKLINIFTDDPFNFNSPATSSQNIIKSINHYNLFCIWSKKIKKKLENKYRNKNFYYLPFGFSEKKHKLVKQKIIKNKISFIGSYDENRYKFLNKINRKIDIYGNDWPNLKKHQIHPYIKNQDLSRIVAKSEICINILKKQNYFSHNMRTFEIPSMGGLMLTRRTEEQKKFFPENKASLMFSSLKELNMKIDKILKNQKLNFKIRQNAYRYSKKHSYKNRLNCLIKYINANKKSFYS